MPVSDVRGLPRSPTLEWGKAGSVPFEVRLELLGAGLVLLALAAAMVLTRRVDWYALQEA